MKARPTMPNVVLDGCPFSRSPELLIFGNNPAPEVVVEFQLVEKAEIGDPVSWNEPLSSAILWNFSVRQFLFSLISLFAFRRCCAFEIKASNFIFLFSRFERANQSAGFLYKFNLNRDVGDFRIRCQKFGPRTSQRIRKIKLTHNEPLIYLTTIILIIY